MNSFQQIIGGEKQVPSFNFAPQATNAITNSLGIQNPILKTIASIVPNVAQSLLNTPSDFIQGPINFARDVDTGELRNNPVQKVLSDVAPTGESMLNVASVAPVGGVLGQLGKGVLPTIARGAAVGGGYGSAYGALNSMAGGRNLSNVKDYLDNFMRQTLMGGAAGGVLGGALGGLGVGAKKLGELQASPDSQAGFFAGNQAVGLPKTGMFSSLLDKGTRTEVSDMGASIAKGALANLAKGKEMNLADVLDHPKLFDAYPEIAAIPVKQVPIQDAYSIFDPESNTIYLNSNLNTSSQILPHLMHEVQHAIQTVEGFPTGGQAALGDLPTNVYKNLSSEIEARSVADRMGMNTAQRAQTDPYAAQGVLLKDVLTKAPPEVKAALAKLGVNSNLGEPVMNRMVNGKLAIPKLSALKDKSVNQDLLNYNLTALKQRLTTQLAYSGYNEKDIAKIVTDKNIIDMLGKSDKLRAYAGLPPLKGLKDQPLGKNLEQKAIDYFGTTTDPREALFITNDGKMIDGSGKIYGSELSGKRYIDHSEISPATDTSLYPYMQQTNNIRIGVTGDQANIDVVKMPNPQQLQTLEKATKGKTIYADITDPSNREVVAQNQFPNFLKYKEWLTKQKFPQQGLKDKSLADQALSTFGSIKPEELGNFKAFIHPNGQYIQSGGYNGLGDHSDVPAKLFNIPPSNRDILSNESATYGFMKEANAVRIGRNADETFIQAENPLNTTQLNAIKRSLLPDGGTITWEGKNSSQGTTIDYKNETDGIKQLTAYLNKTGMIAPKGLKDMPIPKGKTIGQLQEEYQKAEGRGFLADYDKAIRDKDFNTILDIVGKVLDAKPGSVMAQYQNPVLSHFTQYVAPIIEAGQSTHMTNLSDLVPLLSSQIGGK